MARTSGSSADITRDRLRSSALSLFARQGYAAVSMRQIARDVGVQVGALYNYTPDKQTLLFDLMCSHLQDLLAAFDIPPDLPPKERLNRFVAFHIRFHHTRPDAVFIAYMELRNLTAENFEKVEELRRTYEIHLEKIIEDGVASGDFEVDDSRIAARAVIAMLTGVITWFRADGPVPLRDVEAQYSRMIEKALGRSVL